MRVDPQDLVVTKDIAEMVGVGANAVSNWRHRYPDFPAPVIELAGGEIPVYSRKAVAAWLYTTGRFTAEQFLQTAR